MPQIQVDDSFHTHPKVIAAGNAAIGLYLRLACWVSQYKVLDRVVPHDLLRFYGTDVQVRCLVAAGLLTEDSDGFVLNNCLYSKVRPEARTYIPRAVRAAVFNRDGHRCVACAAVDDLTLDHIYPWSLGGPDSEDNLRVLCRSCNSSKGAKV